MPVVDVFVALEAKLPGQKPQWRKRSKRKGYSCKSAGVQVSNPNNSRPRSMMCCQKTAFNCSHQSQEANAEAGLSFPFPKLVRAEKTRNVASKHLSISSRTGKSTLTPAKKSRQE